MAEILKRNHPYPLGDLVPGRKRKYSNNIMAIWDGEKRRKPKAGDWFLSGASIHAYYAPNDLDTEYHISKLVKVINHVTYTFEDV
jgi:hypothetical protein